MDRANIFPPHVADRCDGRRAGVSQVNRTVRAILLLIREAFLILIIVTSLASMAAWLHGLTTSGGHVAISVPLGRQVDDVHRAVLHVAQGKLHHPSKPC